MVLDPRNSRLAPNGLNALRDDVASRLNPLVLDQDWHWREDSIARHTSMHAYQSGVISGQFRILSSIKMGMPESVYLQKIIDFNVCCVIPCCVRDEEGAIGRMQRRMPVLVRTLLSC